MSEINPWLTKKEFAGIISIVVSGNTICVWPLADQGHQSLVALFHGNWLWD